MCSSSGQFNRFINTEIFHILEPSTLEQTILRNSSLPRRGGRIVTKKVSNCWNVRHRGSTASLVARSFAAATVDLGFPNSFLFWLLPVRSFKLYLRDITDPEVFTSLITWEILMLTYRIKRECVSTQIHPRCRTLRLFGGISSLVYTLFSLCILSTVSWYGNAKILDQVLEKTLRHKFLASPHSCPYSAIIPTCTTKSGILDKYLGIERIRLVSKVWCSSDQYKTEIDG